VTLTFLPHEKKILSGVVETLDVEPKRLCQLQLAEDLYIERSHPRINIIRLYEESHLLRIIGGEFEDALFKVRLAVENMKEAANVTFYRGFIFSIETKRPRKFYKDKTVAVLGVEVGAPDNSFTRAIDRLEHKGE
jgi:hypothetical protein